MECSVGSDVVAVGCSEWEVVVVIVVVVVVVDGGGCDAEVVDAVVPDAGVVDVHPMTPLEDVVANFES